MNCPQCSAENADGAKFCSKCGAGISSPQPELAPVAQVLTECPTCQAPRKDSAKFCGSCGYRYEDDAAAIPASATVAPSVSSVSQDQAKADSSSAPLATGDVAKGNNIVVIVIIIALIAIIGAAGTGWYLWSKNKSASASSDASTTQAGTPGQPNVDANGMPLPQAGPAPTGANGMPTPQPGQAGQPQVDANGMPLPQAGQAPTGANGMPTPQPGQAGQPQLDANGMPLPQAGQAGMSGQQPGAAPQQQGSYGQQPEVMPDQMPKEARRRRAQSEAHVSPRRGVHGSGSIDDQFRQRSAAECPAGGSGFFCREKLRYRLCNGRWSSNPQPGQSTCQQTN